MILTITPKNIAIPPISGTEPVCVFRLLGLSTRSMLIAKGRSKNIATKVVIEAISIGKNGIFKKIIYKKLIKTTKQKKKFKNLISLNDQIAYLDEDTILNPIISISQSKVL